MKAYPVELRQRILEAVDNQLDTNNEIAEIFGVHQTFIYKLLRQRSQTGEIAPLPHGGGQTAKLDEADLDELAKLSRANPDATLDELSIKLKKKIRKKVSVSTIWRALEKLNITRKKRVAKRVKPILMSGQSFKANKQA